jgi:peptide/nickel transport system ATP-binding protein
LRQERDRALDPAADRVAAGKIVSGKLRFQDKDLLAIDEAGMRELRGNEISMIFQEPMTSLNPVLTSAGRSRRRCACTAASRRRGARRRGRHAAQVDIPEPERRAGEYPHQLSGGMRQRVMIAMALACQPRLLIADEPTTALDVTIQAQILDLMRALKEKSGAAIVLITHDLGVVAEMAQRVVVMYAGRKVEEAPSTRCSRIRAIRIRAGLLNSVPRLGEAEHGIRRLAEIPGVVPSLREEIPGACSRRAAPMQPSAAGANTRRSRRRAAGTRWPAGKPTACRRGSHERAPRREAHHQALPGAQGRVRADDRQVHAVDDVSFTIGEGETLGLVGESGCGKSTTGKAILRLVDVTSGSVEWRGKRIDTLGEADVRPFRRELQAVFQDPYSSLNPRMRAGGHRCRADPQLRIRGKDEIAGARRDALRKVGLRPDQMVKYPYEFSGGQRQRLGIARALAPHPRLIVCDEPVSALDVSVQAQVINLLRDLQQELGLSYLFVAHDLAVVEHISHRVAVMYLGKIVELADRRSLFAQPQHPYTEALLSAVPVPDPKARASGSSSRAMCRARPNPPPAAAFTRAARMRSSAAVRRSPR